MKKIFDYFIQGLLWLIPVSVVVYLTYQIFLMADGLLRTPLEKLIGITIPGLGIVACFLFISFFGFFGQTILALPFRRFFNNLLDKAPIIRSVYRMTKDLLEAFVGKERKFEYPVLVKVNMISNLEKMGFITQHDLSNIHIPGRIAVYFPHSYNFSGELFFVPSEHITPLDIPSGEAMKFIVSGGIIGINNLDEKPTKGTQTQEEGNLS